jgi:hypothetical protein
MRKVFLISIMSFFLFYSPAIANLQSRGNGTVTDLRTGLIWQQAEIGEMTWTQALTYCQNLSLGGFNDWRLPNCIELQSIVDFSKRYPAIDTRAFPGALPACYWSSTPYALHSGIAWLVDFNDGIVSYGLKSSYYFVRAVRGGR